MRRTSPSRKGPASRAHPFPARRTARLHLLSAQYGYGVRSRHHSRLTCVCNSRYNIPQVPSNAWWFRSMHLASSLTKMRFGLWFGPKVTRMSMDLAATRRLADLREEKTQETSQAVFSSRYVRFGEFLLDLQRQDLIKQGERL